MQVDQQQADSQDSDLISRYKRENNVSLLGKLYDPYMPLVYGVCLKYLKDRDEAKDAVMQIFEKLVEALKKHEVSNFKSWLYTLSRNYCLMKLRAEKNVRFEEISPSLVMESDLQMHHGEEPDAEQNVRKLEKCMERLVDDQKRCVQLFYLEQKCYKDIEVITGLDNNKVKSHIQNGKRNLKICMERDE